MLCSANVHFDISTSKSCLSASGPKRLFQSVGVVFPRPTGTKTRLLDIGSNVRDRKSYSAFFWIYTIER